jgi:predicted ATPase
VDLPARERTLRATVEWSVGLLTDDERSLLEVTAVFVDGWTVPAAAEVAGLEEERALELSEAHPAGRDSHCRDRRCTSTHTS